MGEGNYYKTVYKNIYIKQYIIFFSCSNIKVKLYHFLGNKASYGFLISTEQPDFLA